MKDIRILPVEERLAPLISLEDGFLVASLSPHHSTLKLESSFYNSLSSFLIKGCSCGISECRQFSSYPVINWADRLVSPHVISFNAIYQDKPCIVQVIQSSDLSSLTLISHTHGFFRTEDYIGCYLKFTPNFVSSFPFYFKQLLAFENSLNSVELKSLFSSLSSKDSSAVFNFRLLLSDSNSVAKSVAKREIKNYNRSLNSSETLETANDWDENFFTVFPLSSNHELITSSGLISFCIFITFFAFILFFWKLFHTLFMKLVRFLGLVTRED